MRAETHQVTILTTLLSVITLQQVTLTSMVELQTVKH